MLYSLEVVLLLQSDRASSAFSGVHETLDAAEDEECLHRSVSGSVYRLWESRGLL